MISGVCTAKGDKEKLDNLLITHHRIAISVQLLNMSHSYIGDVSNRLMSGQVDIDAAAEESTRQATIELLDPKFELHLDGEAPEDGSIFYTRMIRIIYSVISIDGNTRFDIPIFCGPIAKVDRNGPTISVNAVGKDKLSMSQVWTGKTYKKGYHKTWLIINILSEIAGEATNKINATDGSPKGEKAGKITFDTDATAWKVVKNIASSMGRQLFYDGRGICQLRRKSNSTIYTFRSQGALLSLPQVSYDIDNLVNAVEVVGAKPKGKKDKIRYRVVAPKAHPLSPWSMGRNGKPRYLPERIEEDGVKSVAKARALAKARLKTALLESVNVAFDSLPIPYLEEDDLVRVTSDAFTGSFRIEKFSIPLTADGTMSVGYLKRVTPSKRFMSIRNTTKKRRKVNR